MQKGMFCIVKTFCFTGKQASPLSNLPTILSYHLVGFKAVLDRPILTMRNLTSRVKTWACYSPSSKCLSRPGSPCLPSLLTNRSLNLPGIYFHQDSHLFTALYLPVIETNSSVPLKNLPLSNFRFLITYDFVYDIMDCSKKCPIICPRSAQNKFT